MDIPWNGKEQKNNFEVPQKNRNSINFSSLENPLIEKADDSYYVVLCLLFTPSTVFACDTLL